MTPYPPFRPRAVAAALSAAVLLSSLAACGTGPAESGDGDAAIKVEHALGTLELDAPPKRVVSLSVADTDAALAVGVTPVAIGAFWLGDTGIATWEEEQFSDTDVTVIKPAGDGEIPIEQVANAAPDVILANGLYTIDDQYDRLQEIAPTLAYASDSGAGKDTWQQTVKAVGAVLGKSEEAEKAVSDLEGRISSTVDDHPGFKGAEFSFTQASRPGVLDVMRTDDDVTIHFFHELGLRMSKRTLELKGTTFVSQIDYEGVDVIDSDVVLLNYSAPDLRDDVEKGPVFKHLSAVEKGGYVPLTNEDFAPVRASTVLSIPEALDLLVPKLDKAVG